MKAGWTYKKLGEVISFQNGFAFKSSLFRKDGLPIVRISSIQDEEIKETDLVRFYPSDYDVNFDNYKILPNDILIAMSGGTTGKLGINKSDKVYYQNQRVGVIRENKKCLDHLFLYYFLHTKSEESLKIAAGAAQPNLSTAQIKDFVIPLPPLSEQQRIVSRLDSAFAHIDELKANAEKQLSEARALFQKSLAKAMEPKEGWKEKTLGQLGDLKNGMNFVHNEKGVDLHILGVGDFGNRFSIDDVRELQMISLNQQPSEDYLLKDGDIVFVRSNGNKQLVGRSLVVYPGDNSTTFSGFCIRFRKSLKVLDERFLVYLLKSDNTRKKLFVNGANISNLNQKTLQSLIVPLPPLSEQQRIVSRLDSLSAHVRELEEVLQKTIAECDALKQALLRQVFE